jgi:membrane protein
MSDVAHGNNSELVMDRPAETPQRLSLSDWKGVLLRTFRSIGDDRVMLVAAGVTYFLLLSLFPAVTAFVSVYGLFVDPTTLGKQLDVLSNIVPAGGLAVIRDQLARVTEHGAPTLGLTLIISLIVALWSASSGVKALFDVMNIAYDQKERRNFFVLNAVALLFTLLGVVGAAIMLAVVVALPAVLSIIGLGKGLEWLVQIGGYIVMLLVLLTGIAALYRFGPSRQHAEWRWITPGAILALVVIGVVSALFSWYAASFGHFDQTYGSLGALIGFLFWMWVSVSALIVGAELNSELERQTAPDAKRDAAPIGERDVPAIGGMPEGHDQAGTQDDAFAVRSSDWIAGYNAALRGRTTPPRSRLSLMAGLPVVLALGLFKRRGAGKPAP